jgi:hypothetical protein
MTLRAAVENLARVEAENPNLVPIVELAAIFQALKEHAKLYRLRPRHCHSVAKAERRLKKLHGK